MLTHEHPSDDDGIDGGYIQFQTAVLRQLPRPDEIDPAVRQKWLLNQQSLRDALRGALVPRTASGDLTIGEVFTRERTVRLGFAPGLRHRIWNVMHI